FPHPPPTPLHTLSLHDALPILRATQGEHLGHVLRLGRLTAADCLTLDETAVETLELLRAAAGGVRHSLVGALDETVTPMGARRLDRKSTRLNSSHVSISYAVFC